jgi:hypothetical protein
MGKNPKIMNKIGIDLLPRNFPVRCQLNPGGGLGPSTQAAARGH